MPSLRFLRLTAQARGPRLGYFQPRVVSTVVVLKLSRGPTAPQDARLTLGELCKRPEHAPEHFPTVRANRA
jgi:hypothetical protein